MLYKLSLENCINMKKDILNGMKMQQALLKYEVSDSAYYRAMKYYKIPLPKNNEIHNKYQELIDLKSSFSQYLLGLIISDGWLTDNYVGIELKDQQLLLDISNKLDIKLHKRTNRDSYYIYICSMKYIKKLNTIGITNNKSSTVKLKDYKINYNTLLGIIDGDGCVTHYTSINKKTGCKKNGSKITIFSNSKYLIKQIEDFYKSQDILFYTRIIDNSLLKNPIIKNTNQEIISNSITYSISVNNKISLLILINNIYNETRIFLNRKYGIAQYIRNYIIESPKLRKRVSTILKQASSIE